MFTGIIEEIGNVLKEEPKGDGKEITVSCSLDFINGVKIGDSIAVNGACQTVTILTGNSFTFFSSKQTLELTNLAYLKVNHPVNLEKALSLSQRLDGHIVSGHIDGMGMISSIIPQKEGYLFTFSLPNELMETAIKKGSISLDGISLTIYEAGSNTVTVSVIPLTYQNTILKYKKVNDKINIETDMLGKYVVNFLKKMNPAGSSKISLDFLKENGFL